MRKLSLFSFISFFVLVACQSTGPMAAPECVAGFVKTASGCRSVKSLSSDELYEANSRLSSQIEASEADLATRIETKKMIDKMKETEAANRRAQMAEARMTSEGTAATGSNYSRTQAPVGFLDERTTPSAPRVTEKAALRNELKESFASELRSKNNQPGSSLRANGFQ
ncbi:MAG: hypothetical protein JSU04_04705 [Bdellovibrionales bacterium]|nr:hypothetical protein [Bdellovibrionales bacterium]